MFRNHLKITWRHLRRNLLVTGLNVFGLAIGMVVCLFVGIWVHRELSYDNFHEQVDSIFRLSNTFQSESELFSQAPCAPAVGANLPRELPGVTATCRYYEETVRLGFDDRRFVEENVITADSNFFTFFTFPLLKGDPATALIHPNSIVLTERLAQKYFGRRDPIGEFLLLGDTVLMTVTGVAADPPVHSQIQFLAVTPMSFLKRLAAEQWGVADIDQIWLGGWMYTFARLRHPADWKETERRMNEVYLQYAGAELDSFKMSYVYHLQPMRDVHLHSNLRYDASNNGSMSRVWIFASVGLIVLLLAGINYVNLATAQALSRAKETGIRKTVGAGRSQLVTQYLGESVITALLAGFLAVALFQTALPGFERLTGQPFATGFSWGNLALLAGFVLLVGGLAGIYPAFVLSSFRPSLVLKGGNLNTPGGGGNWLRKGLVVIQFTATVVLLAGILVINRQMAFIQSKDIGFRGDAVLEVNFLGADQVGQRYDPLRNELLNHPAVKNVALHQASLGGRIGNGWTTTEDLQGKEVSTSAYFFGVQPDFFDIYRMQLLAGRFFSPDIPTDTAKAVLVNEAAVRTFGWQRPENALGKRFGKGEQAKYVVGVVRDFHFESLHKPVEAMVLHFSKGNQYLSLRLDLAQAKDAIFHLERTWNRLLPEVPLQYAFVDKRVADRYGNERTMESLFVIFSSLSLFIACLGLFGLATFLARQKTKEIGIRKVLGASVAAIVGLLSKDFLKLVLLALLLAAPLAYFFMNRWLQDFAYRVDIPWWVFALAGGIAVTVTFLTVSFQSVKAALANPVESLRNE